MTALIGWLMAAASAVQAPPSLAAALAGAWTGTLEYRDYRSDNRVTLPTELVVTAANGGLEYAYVYDDGPGKVVKSTDRVTIDAGASTYRVQNADGYDATFNLTGQYAGLPATLVLSGTGTENDVPVELRVTVTLTSATLTMLRESRASGGEWLFRNRYDLRRK